MPTTTCIGCSQRAINADNNQRQYLTREKFQTKMQSLSRSQLEIIFLGAILIWYVVCKYLRTLLREICMQIFNMLRIRETIPGQKLVQIKHTRIRY